MQYDGKNRNLRNILGKIIEFGCNIWQKWGIVPSSALTDTRSTEILVKKPEKLVSKRPPKNQGFV